MHYKAFQGGEKAPQELNEQGKNEKHKENRDVSLFFFFLSRKILTPRKEA